MVYSHRFRAELFTDVCEFVAHIVDQCVRLDDPADPDYPFCRIPKTITDSTSQVTEVWLDTNLAVSALLDAMGKVQNGEMMIQTLAFADEYEPAGYEAEE